MTECLIHRTFFTFNQMYQFGFSRTVKICHYLCGHSKWASLKDLFGDHQPSKLCSLHQWAQCCCSLDRKLHWKTHSEAFKMLNIKITQNLCFEIVGLNGLCITGILNKIFEIIPKIFAFGAWIWYEIGRFYNSGISQLSKNIIL